MITILNRKEIEQDLQLLDTEDMQFELPANDNISSLGAVDIDEIANDNKASIDQREIGVQFGNVIETDDESNAFTSSSFQREDEMRELDFSEKQSGGWGYLSDDTNLF